MYYVFANADFFDYILYINNDSIFLWTVKHFPSFCTDVRYLEGTYVSYVLNVFTFDIQPFIWMSTHVHAIGIFKPICSSCVQYHRNIICMIKIRVSIRHQITEREQKMFVLIFSNKWNKSKVFKWYMFLITSCLLIEHSNKMK